MEGRVGPYSGQCCGLYSNWRREGSRLPPAYCLFWTMCSRSILNKGKWLLKVFTSLGQERSTAPVAPSCGIRTLKGSFSDAPGKESPGSETNRSPEIYTPIQTGKAKKKFRFADKNGRNHLSSFQIWFSKPQPRPKMACPSPCANLEVFHQCCNFLKGSDEMNEQGQTHFLIALTRVVEIYPTENTGRD